MGFGRGIGTILRGDITVGNALRGVPWSGVTVPRERNAAEGGPHSRTRSTSSATVSATVKKVLSLLRSNTRAMNGEQAAKTMWLELVLAWMTSDTNWPSPGD